MKKTKNKIGSSFIASVSKQAINKLSITLGLLIISNISIAQNNVSYNQNAVPINGTNNTAFGSGALKNVGNCYGNTAQGYEALFSNVSGTANTAIGDRALRENKSRYNTANGSFALYNNTTGESNTAVGCGSSYYNVSGGENVAIGSFALYTNASGNNNFAAGTNALFYIKGSYNIGIGYNAGPTYGPGNFDNSIAIGYNALMTASGQVRIGNPLITSIGGYQAWSNVSDQRVKKDIEEKVPGLAFINKLRPVTYHLDLDAIDAFYNIPENKRQKKEGLSVNMLHTGLLAQEVEKVANELGYEFSGVDKPKNSEDLYGLRYSEFTIPLIKAVQELSKENEAIKKEHEAMKNDNETMKKELSEIKNWIKNNSTTGITDPVGTEESELYQNVPNPFDQSTSIGYSISSSAKKAVLTIVSIDGKKMKEYTVNGKGAVEISAGELAAGSYIYSLLVDGKLIGSKKITLTQ